MGQWVPWNSEILQSGPTHFRPLVTRAECPAAEFTVRPSSPALRRSLKNCGSPWCGLASRKRPNAAIVQDKQRGVFRFIGVLNERKGQVIKDQPSIVLIYCDNHMVLDVIALMHDHDPDAICSDAHFAKRKVFCRRIGLTITLGVDGIKCRQPFAWLERCDRKIDCSIDVSNYCQALLLSRFGDDLPQSARWSALGRRAIDAGTEQRMVASKLLVHSLPAVDERPLRHVNGIPTKRINGSRINVIRHPDHNSDDGQNFSRCHHSQPTRRVSVAH